MTNIIKKFLLTGDSLISEIHLKQPGFTYSGWRPFKENKERTQKLKEAGGSGYIYQNEPDRTCF